MYRIPVNLKVFICRMIGDYTAWLGLTDSQDEGIYTWLNGAPLYYSAWHGTEPGRQTIENYAALHISHRKWVDLHRNREVFALCSTTGKLNQNISFLLHHSFLHLRKMRPPTANRQPPTAKRFCIVGNVLLK